MKKTRIFGFGDWKHRSEWPHPNIKVEISSITILGITFAHAINTAIDISWSNILTKIKQTICMLSSRYFTIFQRATLINAIVLSKVWYTAHTDPLPNKYSKLISKEIFEFLWKSKYNPIKRDIVYQSKCNGGLGVLNVFYKAQSILISTFLKQFLESPENHSIIKYYCSLRLNPIFNIRELPTNVSYVCPKYLEDLVQLTRKLIHIPKFPVVNSRDIYSIFLPKVHLPGNQAIIINWKRSWKHNYDLYIYGYSRKRNHVQVFA